MQKNNSLKTGALFLGIILIGLIVQLFNSHNELLLRTPKDLASVPCIWTNTDC
jgi:hypothetical protein